MSKRTEDDMKAELISHDMITLEELAKIKSSPKPELTNNSIGQTSKLYAYYLKETGAENKVKQITSEIIFYFCRSFIIINTIHFI